MKSLIITVGVWIALFELASAAALIPNLNQLLMTDTDRADEWTKFISTLPSITSEEQDNKDNTQGGENGDKLYDQLMQLLKSQSALSPELAKQAQSFGELWKNRDKQFSPQNVPSFQQFLSLFNPFFPLLILLG